GRRNTQAVAAAIHVPLASGFRIGNRGTVAAKRSGLIETLEREWRDALCAMDIAHLRALMHPRFTLIGTRASGPFILTRDEWLEAIEKRHVVDIQSEVRDAIEFESMMIATTEAKWRVSYLGQ